VALTIVPTFDSSITSDPNATTIEGTINQAIAEYHSMVTTLTPTTVNITFQEMSGGLGSSLTSLSQQTYVAYRAALLSHASSANDTTANASLPVQTNSPADNKPNMWLSTANARALGFSAATSTDSTIGLNTSIMNYTRPPGDPINKYDLKAVTEHEIDEALGLGSGLNFSTTTPPLRQSRPEDLFRYSAPGVRSYDTAAAASYFSIDGGTTIQLAFNQANDGSDFGDWASSATPHVQDAVGTPGATPNLNVELTALDVIGYNLSPVPEPGTLALVGAGLAAAGFVRRRRNAIAA
jgi:hypothetical protein